MNNNYSNGIISKPNISAGNPYGVFRYFLGTVAKNKTIQISMLNEQQGIRILRPDNIFETNNIVNIGENEFYIDYAAQIIYFNERQIGQEIVFEAYDMGEDLILDHKICTLVDNNGNPKETLKDIIDKGYESIDYLNTVGSAIEITDLLKAEIENGKNMVGNLQDKIVMGGNTITQLTNTTNEAKATNTSLTNTNNAAKATDVTLKTTTTNANNKNTELNTTITSSEAERLELTKVVNNAGISKSQLQSTVDDSVSKKSQLQAVIDDSVIKNNILVANIGSANITTMKTDITNLQNNKLNKAELELELGKINKNVANLSSDMVDGCHVDDTVATDKNLWTSKKIKDSIFTSFRGGLGLSIGNNWTSTGVRFDPDVVTNGAFTWIQLDITGNFSNNGVGVAGITSVQNRPKINVVLPCVCANGNTFYNGYILIESSGTIKVFCNDSASFTRFFGSGTYPSIN